MSATIYECTAGPFGTMCNICKTYDELMIADEFVQIIGLSFSAKEKRKLRNYADRRIGPYRGKSTS